MITQDEIEWREYPTSEKTLTPDEATVALANEKATFGYCISSITPQGQHRVLVNGQWHNVVVAPFSCPP